MLELVMGILNSRLGEKKPKKPYIALFDYSKQEKEELNMRKNEKILVLENL